MPRTFVMTCDRYLADKVTPGNRVKIVGVFSILDKHGSDANSNKMKTAINMSYIRVVGI